MRISTIWRLVAAAYFSSLPLTQAQTGPSNPQPPAPTVRQAWVARYADIGTATDMTVDAAGNVYVTGKASTFDFIFDYATVKYSPAGQQLWVARYDYGAGDEPTDVVVDATGNVYVTGTSVSPGAGSSREDYATVKYSPTGQQLWVARFNGGPQPQRNHDQAAGLAVDAAGNVFVTGTSSASASGFAGDIATVKYSPTGQLLWATPVPANSRATNRAVDLRVDAAGDVYVTDLAGRLAKLAGTSGQQQWQVDIGYQPVDLAVDLQGVYVTGSTGGPGTGQLATSKYAGASGQRLWSARYNSPGSGDAMAAALAVDPAGNVVVTGASSRDSLSNYYAFITIKYSPLGQLAWEARYTGAAASSSSRAADVTVDAAGDVYVTGNLYIGQTSTYDLATIKYAGSSGQPFWAARYKGSATGSDNAVRVAVDAAGKVSVAGSTSSKVYGTLGGFLTLQYAQTSNPSPGPLLVGPIHTNTAVGACGALVDFAAPVSGPLATTVTYALPSGPITSPHVFPVGESTVTATASSSAGTFQQTFLVTVTDTEAPTLTVPAEFLSFPATADSCAVTRRLPTPTVTEPCGQVTVVGVRSDSLALSAPFPVGQTSLLWQATDEAGNVTQVRQYINVFEETLPVARAKPVTVHLVNGQASVTAEQVNDGSTDNCGIAYMTLSRTEFTAADLGPNPVTLLVWDRSGNLDSAQAVVTVLPTTPTSGPARYRLHAGGEQLSTSLGAFAADQYAVGGSVFATDQPIAGTADEALYQTERYGAFTYNLPVPNGQYTVKLHFAEIYWRAPGQRVFDVAAEGTTVLRSYDIVQKVGPLTATTESFPVTVSDGVLTLTFAPGAAGVDLPKVSAIEVLEIMPTAVIRLHAGGGPLTTSIGTFAADQYAAGGSEFVSTAPIADTEDDGLYQTERYGSFTYNLPVPNGQYTVKLHFAEIYWNSVGQRVFDVAAEGTTVLQAFDIVRKVGPLTATTETFSVTVTDGVLSLAFGPGAGGVDQPKVSAIEVLNGGPARQAANSAARTSASPLATVNPTKLPVYSAQVQLYPNPSTDGRVTVELPAAFQGDVTYTLVSSLGTILGQGQRTLARAGQLLIFDFSQQLPAEGLYYLHLRGAKGQAQVKLLRK